MKLYCKIFSVLCVVLLLNACDNSTPLVTKEEQKKADSLSIKLNSPELKALNTQLLNEPDNPELYNKRSQLYIQYKQFEEAIGDAKRAIRLDSTKADYYVTLADVYFAENKTRQTKEILERTVKKFPESTEALMKLSELFFIVKQYQNALDNINAALKVNENIAKAYYLKGSIYRESGDTGKAVSSLETAIEQDNKFYDAFYDLGIIYSARKNPLALDYFSNALRLQPTNMDVVYAKAKFLQDVGKADDAIKEYELLLSKNKNYINAYYNLGAIYLEYKKDFKKSVEYFTKTIELNDQWANAYFARGYAYSRMGDKENAKKDYKQCLNIESNFEAAIQGLNEL